ncbi:hypothetical protein BDR07DRAFT_1492592 [Suillus spraguei]|nr:hypothetical protein BDR07DRAFT_1492592 [Suillus spraguei]
MDYQAGSNQALIKNTIGDFLTAYGTSNVSVMKITGAVLRSLPLPNFAPDTLLGSSVEYGKVDKGHDVYYDIRLAKRSSHLYPLTGGNHPDLGYHHIGRWVQPHQIQASDPSFDFSYPIDLIIAAFGGKLKSELYDKGNEDLTVRFEDVPDKAGRRSKRLVTVVPEPLSKIVLNYARNVTVIIR